MGTRAAIKAIASFLPAGTLTNAQLADELGDWDAHEILEKTGIAVRHVAAPDECASDLGVAAAQRLFESGACAREDIDFLLFCTQSPDYFLPTTACTIQDRLGLRTDCGAIDFNQGCSGFVYGLALAKSLIEAAAAHNVLLITAETYTKFIHPRDRSVRTIFGDGAAATLVGPVDGERELLGPFVFGTDGRGAQELIVPGGGRRRPVAARSVATPADDTESGRTEQHLYMNGPEIFNFTLQAVPRALAQLLARSGRTAADIDLFVFHQANKFMLERLRAKLRIPEQRFWIDLETGGNTVSSTIPMALERALAGGRIRPGHEVALVGFGVGYSWAATIMRAI
jgi:3-oxoacyl-[acyl-carrier-protein] synthase III